MLAVSPNYSSDYVDPLNPTDRVIKDKQAPYFPDEKTKAVITMVQKDCAIADLVRKKVYPEFNWSGLDEDLISYMSEMQKRFNSTPPAPSADPDDEWKSNHVEPMTRNKVISIVASVTNAIMEPKTKATNSDNEEDVAAANVMEDMIQYVNRQTDYDDRFLMSVQEMCVNPGVVLHQSYAKIKNKQKIVSEDGKSFTVKEVEDPTLSGFQMDVVPLDELYISNFYEPNIQRQDFIIWRRAMTFDQAYMEAKDKDGFLENVKPGVRLYFDSNSSLFFHQNDNYLEGRLVYRDIYYNKKKDLCLTFYSGWIDGNINSGFDRCETPLPRLDKMYPFAITGYERYNAWSFYFMPLVAKLALVQDEMDIIHRALTDGTILSIFPPLNSFGAEVEEVTSISPGALNSYSHPDSRVEPMTLAQNLQPGYQLLQDQKRTADESSQSPQAQGLSGGGRQTLGEVELLQQNTQIQLGLIGRAIGRLVRGYGNLLAASIIQHMTVGEVLELAGEFPKMKYNTLIVPDVERLGDKKTSIIDFNSKAPTSAEDEIIIEHKILALEKKHNQTIYQINPSIFKELKFSIYVDTALEDKTSSFSKRIFAFDRMKMSPLVDQEANLKYNLIEPLYPGESTRFIKDKEVVAQEMQMAGMGQKNPVGRPANPVMDPSSMPNMPQ